MEKILNINNKKPKGFQTGHKYGKGRPKGSRSKATIMIDQIGYDNAEGVINTVIESALNGDIAACKMVIDRVWPAMKLPLVNISLPKLETIADMDEASANVFDKMAKGEISIDQAEGIFNLIEKRRKVYETNVLAIDVAELKITFNKK